MSKKNVIMVVGGETCDETIINTINSNPDCYIMGVDRGAEVIDRLGIEADMVIGDFDSADSFIRDKYQGKSNAIFLNPVKDATDTHMAVLEAIKLKPNCITILGATGGRLDHMMGNFALLKLCVDQGVSATIIDEHNKITMIDKQMKISKQEQYGKYVSLIPFSDVVTGVSLTGFAYGLSNATMIKADTIGISNEIREEEGFISIKTGYLMVMETKD
ncbi:MAG: thiamine diphosphokinase [Lachnospiraceae bacterium]|nr:thiamine diphosphokinase [Lachnospiraceae bacterium]